MDSSEVLLKEGIKAAAANKHGEAVALFKRVVELEPRNEAAWLWLAELAESDKERTTCLENVLRINPENQGARELLGRLLAKGGGTPLVSEPEVDDEAKVAPSQPAGEEQAAEPGSAECSNCGTRNRVEARFCGQCGAPLLEREETQEAGTVTDAGPSVVQSTIHPVAQEDVPSVVRVTERRPSGMRYLAAPAAAVGATFEVYNRLAGLELIEAYGTRTPMLQAIFDPETVSVLGVDMSAHLMLQLTLEWVAFFSVIWLANAVVISIVDWARGRSRPD